MWYQEYEQLQAQISNVLDETLNKIAQLNGSVRAQLVGKPSKAKEINNLSTRLNKSSKRLCGLKKINTETASTNNTVKTALPEHLRVYIDWLNDYLGNRKENNNCLLDTSFSNQEIYQVTAKSQKTIRNYHRQLMDKEVLKVVAGNHNLGYTYSLLI